MSGPSIAEFDPISVGPFEISRLPLSGAVAAAGYLAGLALAVRQVRRAGLDPSLALELFAAGVPAVLLASRLPALAASFPEFLHDGRALASALVAPGSILLGLASAILLVAAFAWASRRPATFLDALGPGAALVAAGVAAAHRHDRLGAVLGACGIAAAFAGMAATPRLRRVREGAVAALLGACIAALLISSLRG